MGSDLFAITCVSEGRRRIGVWWPAALLFFAASNWPSDCTDLSPLGIPAQVSYCFRSQQQPTLSHPIYYTDTNKSATHPFTRPGCVAHIIVVQSRLSGINSAVLQLANAG